MVSSCPYRKWTILPPFAPVPGNWGKQQTSRSALCTARRLMKETQQLSLFLLKPGKTIWSYNIGKHKKPEIVNVCTIHLCWKWKFKYMLEDGLETDRCELCHSDAGFVLLHISTMKFRKFCLTGCYRLTSRLTFLWTLWTDQRFAALTATLSNSRRSSHSLSLHPQMSWELQSERSSPSLTEWQHDAAESLNPVASFH